MKSFELETCPTEQEIADFLSGETTDLNPTLLDLHLSSCPACLLVLERLDAKFFPETPDLSETWTDLSGQDSGGHEGGFHPRPRFSDLVLRKRIGKGGFGDVYLAQQLSANQRPVAVKILRRELNAKNEARHTRQELDALTQLQHDNIATVFQKSVAADGTIAIVMELVDGEPLSAYLTDESIGFADRLRIADRICSAIQYIHEQGIVHQDLKPSNILLTLQDGLLVPKVIDFGLSVKINRSHLRLLRGAGTKQYMAPEQAGYLNRDACAQSDVYALGICIYELLSGKRATPAFDGETTSEYFERIHSENHELAPLEVFPRRSSPLLESQVKELHTVLAKATARDIDSRYPSAKAMQNDLIAASELRPISLRRNDSLHSCKLLLLRNRWRAAAACIFAVAIVVAFVLTSNAQRRTNAVITESGKFTKKLVDRVNPLIADSVSEFTNEQVVDTAEAVIEEAKAIEFQNHDELLRTRLSAANTLLAIDRHEESIAELQSIAKACDSKFGASNDDTLAIKMHLAHAYLKCGLLDQANDLYSQAHRIWENRYGINDGRTLAATQYKSLVEQRLGNHERAILLCDKVIDRYRSETSNRDLILESVLNTKAKSLVSLSRYREAVTHFQLVKSMYLKHGLSSTHPSVLFVENDIALAESNEGNCASALSRIAGVVKSIKDVYPKNAEMIYRAEINHAVILHRCGMSSDAIEILDRVRSDSSHPEILSNANRQLQAIEQEAEVSPGR